MPSQAKIYYDSDADMSVLDGKRIVFFGFGNQGSAQAQNLRDSGVKDILIANLRDSYAKSASALNFTVEQDFAKAASVADVLFLLIPDQCQPTIFNPLASMLKPGVTIVVASGYNIYYKLLDIPSHANVCMVAPRMIGSSVRSRYLNKKGFPCFVSVEQNATGDAQAIALTLSKAIGATKGGAIASSCKEEAMIDLFAEQALWPQIITAFREAFSVLSAAGCSDEALVHELYLSGEPAEIFEAAAEEGFFAQLKRHSSVSQYGQLKGALDLDGRDVHSRFESVLKNQIMNGKFMREFQAIETELDKSGKDNPIEKLYTESAKSELGVAEAGVFKRLGLGQKVNGTH